MLKLVIFDHDGLMVNSEIVTFKALNKLFKKHDHDFTWEYFLEHIGMSVSESLEIFYKDFPLNISFNEFYAQRDKIVTEYLKRDLEIMPGLLSLLKSINKTGIKMVISTSGKRPYIENSIRRFEIEKYFSEIVCIEDVKRGKPYPDLVLECLRRTNTKAENAIMLEDSPHGIDAANRAGVFSVAIPTKNMDLNKFKEAKLILPDLETLDKVINFLY